MDDHLTPAEQGYVMPAEWTPHAGCLMAWPSRVELWGQHLAGAARDYAAVANAIARFEPVIMVCNPGHAHEVRDLCGPNVRPLETADQRFVGSRQRPGLRAQRARRSGGSGLRLQRVGQPVASARRRCRALRRLAEWLGIPFFHAPFVLEGGAFFVDGEGTLVTTEQCLLNPNRNPHLTRAEIEQGLRDHLGVSSVVWLPHGHSLDTGPAGTDGHIDGVLQYVAPGPRDAGVGRRPDAPPSMSGGSRTWLG